MRRPSLTGAVALLTLFFLALPIIVVVPMSFSSASSLSFPPTALSLRWYRAFFGSDAWLGAMGTSLALACTSSCLCVVLGSLAAYGLRRRRVGFRGWSRATSWRRSYCRPS